MSSDEGVEKSRQLGRQSAGADESWTRRGTWSCYLATTTHWTTTATGTINELAEVSLYISYAATASAL